MMRKRERRQIQALFTSDSTPSPGSLNCSSATRDNANDGVHDAQPSICGQCQPFHEALNCDYCDRRFRGRVATDVPRFPSVDPVREGSLNI
jgi:hypothetical protein